MTYREPIRCVKCLNPWSGWGIICNECRTIDAINNQGSTTSESSSPRSESMPGPIFTAVIWGTFLLIDYNLNFAMCKVMWILLKVGFYLMFGWWMGIEVF